MSSNASWGIKDLQAHITKEDKEDNWIRSVTQVQRRGKQSIPPPICFDRGVKYSVGKEESRPCRLIPTSCWAPPGSQRCAFRLIFFTRFLSVRPAASDKMEAVRFATSDPTPGLSKNRGNMGGSLLLFLHVLFSTFHLSSSCAAASHSARPRDVAAGRRGQGQPRRSR